MKFLKITISCSVYALIYLGFCMSHVLAKNNKNPLELSWREARASSYSPPSGEELIQSSSMFAQLLENNQDKKLEHSRLLKTILTIDNEDFIVISDNLGGGFFVIRKNGNGVLLQAPHAFKDSYTGTIAIRMMLESNYSALALNTVSRSYFEDGIQQNADMAHLEHSYFVSFSMAFARAYPNGQIVQLHGFNSDRREATRDIAMIISTGVKTLDTHLQSQKICLSNMLNEKVVSFPDEVDFLGGTTNRIGRAIRAIGFTGFRHFELHLPLRKKLLTSTLLRKSLSICIKDEQPK